MAVDAIPQPDDSKDRRRRRFRRTLVRLSILVSLPTILSLGARWFWMFELATHFRVQSACAALPLVVACVVGRWYWLALFPAAVLLLNLGLVVPVYFPRAHAPTDGPAIRVVSANVHTGNRSYERFLEYVRSEQPDVVLAVEIDEEWAAALEALEPDYPHAIVELRSDNFGIALYSQLPIRHQPIVELADSEVPTIVARLEADAGTFTVIGTHPLPPVSAAYSGYRNRHLQALAETAAEMPGPVVVLGDLNVTPWSPHFRDLLARGGLRDSRQGFGIQPTWPQHIPWLRIPIDHALISPEVVVLDRKVGPEIDSDHLPIVVEFALAR